MNYLLHNRREFYLAALQRIPDPGIRDRLRQIAAPSLDEPPAFSSVDSSNDLQKLHLEDAVKKPRHGEKLGKSILSVEDLIEKAIRLEEQCCSWAQMDSTRELRQIFDYSTFTIAQLRELADDLRYHRIRLP